MTILQHPLWRRLSKRLRCSKWRIEVQGDPTHFLDIEVACPKCGEPMHTVRVRHGKGGAYFAVTCGDISCVRSQAASNMNRMVRSALGATY